MTLGELDDAAFSAAVLSAVPLHMSDEVWRELTSGPLLIRTRSVLRAWVHDHPKDSLEAQAVARRLGVVNNLVRRAEDASAAEWVREAKELIVQLGVALRDAGVDLSPYSLPAVRGERTSLVRFVGARTGEAPFVKLSSRDLVGGIAENGRSGLPSETQHK